MNEETLRERIIEKAGLVAFLSEFTGQSLEAQAKYQQAAAELKELREWLERLLIP